MAGCRLKCTRAEVPKLFTRTAHLRTGLKGQGKTAHEIRTIPELVRAVA